MEQKTKLFQLHIYQKEELKEFGTQHLMELYIF